MNEFEKQLASQPLKSIPEEWRGQILKAAQSQATSQEPTRPYQPRSWLRELFWPCPQAWGALATIWLVMAAFQLMTPGPAPVLGGEVAKGQVISLAEQRRELSRLLEPTSAKASPPPAARPRGARPVDYAFV